MDKQQEQEQKVRFGVHVPVSVRDGLDRQAKRWKCNRSQAIIRVWLEWQAANVAAGEGV